MKEKQRFWTREQSQFEFLQEERATEGWLTNTVGEGVCSSRENFGLAICPDLLRGKVYQKSCQTAVLRSLGRLLRHHFLS